MEIEVIRSNFRKILVLVTLQLHKSGTQVSTAARALMGGELKLSGGKAKRSGLGSKIVKKSSAQASSGIKKEHPNVRGVVWKKSSMETKKTRCSADSYWLRPVCTADCVVNEPSMAPMIKINGKGQGQFEMNEQNLDRHRPPRFTSGPEEESNGCCPSWWCPLGGSNERTIK